MSPVEFNNIVIGYISIVVTVAGIYLAYKVNLSATSEKQLKYVYSPLFIAIEPNLFKQIQSDTAKHYATLLYETVNQHHILCDPALIELVNIFVDQVNSGVNYDRAYTAICSNIDRHYDKLKRKLGLPRRKLVYRLRHSQYEDKMRFVLAFAGYLLAGLAQFVFVMLATIMLTGIVSMVIGRLLGHLIRP